MEKLNVKRTVLLCLPIVFALSLAITLAACMAQAGDVPADPVVDPAKPVQAALYSEGLAYESRGDGTCALIGIGSCADQHIKIPMRDPAGDLVTSIGPSAFFGLTGVTGVEIPESVAVIGNFAFYGSGLTSVTVPSSVTAIGSCAFTACRSLVSVNVDGGNENYSSIDGVLFSSDKSVLICYPSGKPGESYTIRKGVGTISDAAFFRVPALKSVAFNGTKSEWSAVKIGANNDALTSLTVTFKTASAK